LDLRGGVDHRSWQLASVNTGVPHVVAVVDRLDRVDVERVGRRLRFHRAFHPQGTNVDFVERDPHASSRLRIRTYERGVEAETLACGTGVTAAAVVHAVREAHGARRTSHRLDVETKSGETLTVRLAVLAQGSGRRVTDVTLEGSVHRICQGVFPWPTKTSPQSRRDW
jgi:diaminopimelate epimerase